MENLDDRTLLHLSINIQITTISYLTHHRNHLFHSALQILNRLQCIIMVQRYQSTIYRIYRPIILYRSTIIRWGIFIDGFLYDIDESLLDRTVYLEDLCLRKR